MNRKEKRSFFREIHLSKEQILEYEKYEKEKLLKEGKQENKTSQMKIM